MTMLDIAPELAPFIEAFRGELPAKPREPLGRRPFPPKKPDAPYVFADPFVVNAADWDDLGDTLRMQLIKAVERMMGKKVRSARGVARALDDAPDEFEIRTWDVYDAKATEKDAPVFNCWVFRVDNAVFFRHDTLDRVPVYVLQDSFMNDDGGTASAELAVALEASAPESLWAT
jgi:hypothetical protein